MAKRAAVCLLLTLTLAACRQQTEAPPPAPAPPAPAEAANPEPASPEVNPYERLEPPLSEYEPDAYCKVEGTRYERRNEIWVQPGYADRPVVRTVLLGQDPELEEVISQGRLESVLKLGRVRVWVGEDLVEVMSDDFSDPYGGAVCEARGKVRLPRNLGPMGSALEEQLRRDNYRRLGRLSIKVRFIVDRDGRVRELVSHGGLSDYSDLLLQDLREVQFQPATLDGRPVAVIHSVDLQY